MCIYFRKYILFAAFMPGCDVIVDDGRARPADKVYLKEAEI